MNEMTTGAVVPEQQIPLDNPLLPDPLIVPPDVEVTDDLLINPVEYPIDNQAELAAIDQEDPQTTDVIVGEHTSQLELAASAIGELTDLETTIKKNGVCSHDMTAMSNIQERLAASGMQMPTLSMEGHDAIYLPLRSHLNQTVALEAIGETILATIKLWLKKLIDLVMSGYRWVKNIQNKHKLLDAKIGHAKELLKLVDGVYTKMRVLHPNPTTAYVDSLKQTQEQLLTDGTITRNWLSIYALGCPVQKARVKDLSLTIELTRNQLQSQITAIVRLLEHKQYSTADSDLVLPNLEGAVAIANDMLVIQPDQCFLQEHTPDDLFTSLDGIRNNPVIDFDKLSSCYGSIADVLSKLRNVKTVTGEDAMSLQDTINQLTVALGQVNTLIEFFSSAASAQTEIVKAYRDYLNFAIKQLLADFKQSEPSAESIEEMNKLVKQLGGLR